MALAELHRIRSIVVDLFSILHETRHQKNVLPVMKGEELSSLKYDERLSLFAKSL